ncbi:dCTP deaminase [Bifidobacterium magnum]|uniref:dCTP deaminase, dUMP-forming n=1 Tax=Bifidobacterium magnum TaxID=1692 RepID=A0A087B9M3_9BIFI|nr:dCTP deaminase [Bifidobacterium magnum]KFI67723.1 2'-deoxycytidine 5'-triphosphate deaminase [Bifidobacterium magnum]
MLLSDRDIIHAHNTGMFELTPFNLELVQPASVDVRLSNQFRLFDTPKTDCVDTANPEDSTRLVTIPDTRPFVLHPGQFALACTYERIRLGTLLAARYEGKSSLGRLGLLTHITAGFIDPGFEGSITLELANVSGIPVKLWPGMRIGQLCFFRMSSAPARAYGHESLGSHYQHQQGPTPSFQK